MLSFSFPLRVALLRLVYRCDCGIILRGGGWLCLLIGSTDTLRRVCTYSYVHICRAYGDAKHYVLDQ